MRLVPALSALVFLTACAPAATVAVTPDHPASPDAPTAPSSLQLSALAPAPAPRLPAVLRPTSDGMPAMDSAQMRDGASARASAVDHAAMGHTMPMSSDRPAASASASPMPDSPMAEALDAYLALHDALASDDAAGARAHGAHFAAAFDALAEAPPAADPHFWHSRSADVQAVRTAAADLVDAPDLAASRVAFGHASVPFARLVEAAGLPEGVEIERFRCGMAQNVPDGGIWLQRPGALRNPYFGAAMLTCGSRTGSLSAAPPTTTDAPVPSSTHAGH